MAVSDPRPAFRAGRNIAMKVPEHQYEATVAFYRDVVGLPMLRGTDTPRFEFGGKVLWIDRVPTLSQAEIWLELDADDPQAASRWLDAHGIARRDAIEPLPEGFRGFWIASPADIIHLVNGEPGD